MWIAKELRDEHRKALEWLNEHTGPDVDCFGVVIEVIRIDDSKPAFNFKPVVFPNEWQKDKGGGRPGASSKGEAYRAYFQSLIDELRTKHKFTGARIAQPQSWVNGDVVALLTYIAESFGIHPPSSAHRCSWRLASYRHPGIDRRVIFLRITGFGRIFLSDSIMTLRPSAAPHSGWATIRDC